MAGKKILIIEDNLIVAKIYQAELEKKGFVVEVATEGQAGFYRLHETRPDGVLLDLLLPHISGVEILRKIRAQKQFQNLPVVVYTEGYAAELVNEAIDAGATIVFDKSAITPRNIVEALNAALFPRIKEAFVSRSGAPPGTEIKVPSAMTTGEPFIQQKATALPVPSQTPVNVATGQEHPGTAGKEVAPTSQVETRQAFLNRAPQTLTALGQRLQTVAQSTTNTARQSELTELCRMAHALAENAGSAGLSRVAEIASVIEALFKELSEKPRQINTSSLRTVARVADFLGTLFKQEAQPQFASPLPPMILVVEDDPICRRAIRSALELARLRSVTVGDHFLALTLLEENRFDLIFLGVEMRGMGGFELCKKVRGLPTHSTTPVVFVTNVMDFDMHARSILTGGNDLIAKPFLPVELAVKALTCVLKDPTKTTATG